MLETERLVIREMCPEDLEDIYAIYEGNDLEYTENLYEDKKREYEYIKDYQKYMYNFYEFGIWLFEDKITGEIIGRGGAEMNIAEDGTEYVSLGYIIKKKHQRKGYAMEALLAVIDYVKEYFDISQMRAAIHPQNTASIRLIEKLGFESNGQTELCTTSDGVIENLVYERAL